MGILIKSLQIRNLLSFGPDTLPTELKGLNILIGPNGSGKSNFLEVISLLQAAPKDLSAPVKEVGGVRDWLWKGKEKPIARLEAIITNPKGQMPLRHYLEFTEHGQRFELIEEGIENERALGDLPKPYFFYKFRHGHPILKERRAVVTKTSTTITTTTTTTTNNPSDDYEEKERVLNRETINPEQSILSQVKDAERYPVLSHLDTAYGRIAIFREWSFGRYTAPRQEQKADLRSDFLSSNCDNLALILSKFPFKNKRRILEALEALYPGIEEYRTPAEGGKIQLYLEEGNYSIPATRLSDGTLRYLCLLAILCHPEPPPLVCIEEPELGLHPDVLPELSKLLIEASERTQIIITTHSDVLVDAFSEQPDSIIVCEKENGGTTMKRLDAESLESWLKKYSLGKLWRMGEIGGNRW